MQVRLGCLIILLLVACRPDEIALAYRFDAGATTTYSLIARATASWVMSPSNESGSGSYEAVFEVRETIESHDESGAVVSVVMTPTHVEDRGLPSPGQEVRTFRLRVGPHGEVVRVLEVNGVPAVDLAPEELAFIGTFRPPLPDVPVGLRDTWQTRQDLGSATSRQQLLTVGSLDEVGRDAIGRKAWLDFTGEGPVVWGTRLPQGNTTVTGHATTHTSALIGIDDGAIRSATTNVGGEFEVRVQPSGDANSPISGRLKLELEVRVERLAA